MKLNKLTAPVFVNWALSYKCNYSCLHCYYKEDRKTEGVELTLDDCIWVVDKLDAIQVPYVNFGGGETMLNPLLDPLMRYIKEYSDIEVSMNTNGTGITSLEDALYLKELGFKTIGLSIDGGQCAHDFIRNKKGAFDNINLVSRFLTEADIEKTMSCVISKLNMNELESIITYAVSNNFSQLYLHNLKPNVGNADFVSQYDLSPDEWKKFYEEAIHQRDKNNNIKIVFDDPILHTIPEYQEANLIPGSTCGKASLSIRPDGSITPCGFIPITIGNVIKDDLMDIWNNSEILGQMRNKTAQGKCSRCGDYASCLGGCTARAYSVTGNMNSPDPHCWKL